MKREDIENPEKIQKRSRKDPEKIKRRSEKKTAEKRKDNTEEGKDPLKHGYSPGMSAIITAFRGILCRFLPV
ncbi:MAG: hypothetical protein ACOX8B_06290 [Lachnospiraceae bacterium]